MRTRGFALMELLVAGSILFVAGTVLSGFFLKHVDALELATHQNDLRTQVQIALQSITKQLRHGTRAGAARAVIPAPPNNTQIQWYRPADLDGNGVIVDASGAIEWDLANPVTYRYVAATRQLERRQGAAVEILANDVSAASFEDQAMDPSLNANEVRIRLTLQRTTPQRRVVSAPASAIVQLRN